MGARQIYEALRDQILGGVFGVDGPLPSSRALALELGVSRTTVMAAHEQLLAEGFITVCQGRRPRVAPAVVDRDVRSQPSKSARSIRLSAYGERVRTTPPWSRPEAGKLIADFRYGDLAPSDFPTAVWKRAVNAAMVQRPERLTYGDPRGSRRLRMALQGYLWRSRTLRCDPEQIIIVNGSQQGLDLCARLILDQGDRFVIENPCYAMARQIFAGTGATPVPIAVDDDGLRTDLLAGIDAGLVYVTPSHQFPLGGVMPVSRRHRLLEWARQHDAYVIEDDYDSEYRYDINPVPPLHGLEDSGNVIYLGTISKTLSPTLRIGYLVVPPGLQDVFAVAKRLTDRHSPANEQEALASLIEGGAYERHVRRVRRLNGERRQTLLNVLRLKFGDRIAVDGADAGLHIVVRFKDLPQSLEAALIERARLAGVGVHSTSPLYSPGADGIRADHVSLVMGYSALDTRRIERGVHLLAETIVQVRGDA
ncbi:PLP-dependent aminotransferase family protein [Microvirga sp. HBU67558]|uniref:MocR-like pyridoxine biosynthesis transcription factor PdxR n=1 Tax=Microvirga TaxID=186650 RepID=UPI001B364637|nr:MULTISPECIES: PLP-dependent aminotransferase family protein [unclassified Microvirga]MBQ0822740.1 PLP-dependent aminotransferase family protein [Microvirga sp. HBU67558]